MRQRLFIFAYLMSLLPLTATLVLRVRSYSAEDNLRLGTHGSYARICAWHGEMPVELGQDLDAFGVKYWRTSDSGEADDSNDHELIVETFGRRAGLHGFFGFRWHVNYGDDRYAERGAAVPVWFVALLSSILPLRMAIRKLRVSRMPGVGVCRRCTYSLTGNTSGVCPECGTPVAQSSLST